MRARMPLLPTLLTGAAIAALVGWQWIDLQQRRARDFASHRQFAEALGNAVDGLAVREFRGGLYEPKALGESLEDSRARFGLVYVALVAEPSRGAERLELAHAGALPAVVAPELWLERPFVPLQPLGRGPRRGAVREGVPVPAGALALQVVLDGTQLTAHLAADVQRMVVASAALATLCVVAAVALGARARRAALRSALAASQERTAGLETLRRLGAGLVHETKNPLGVVRGFAERLAAGQLAPSEAREAARAIVDETDRTVARLDEFLLLSRPAKLRREPVAVAELFAQLATLLQGDVAAAGARLVVRTERATIDADRDQLRRLLLNLLLNATQAGAGRGVTIELFCERTPGGVALGVADDGPGVPADLQETLFEPYVSSRPGGTGLGLAIARRIAADHGFTLRHTAILPHGARMTLEVPA